MSNPTSTGMNRTGLQMAPMLSERMLEISSDSESLPGDQLEFARMRQRYSSEFGAVGSMPPPGSMKGMATTAMETLKGNKPTVFIDKLGERLAFERTGVRLYDAVLAKFDAFGSWDQGPSREHLLQIREEELQHFEMLKETIEQLGADPTAMTPSADVAAVETSGVPKVVSDPRTTLPQACHAMMMVESVDNEGWHLLIRLARDIGQDSLADRFEQAQAAEERHAIWMRQWLSSAVLSDAHHELRGGH